MVVVRNDFKFYLTTALACFIGSSAFADFDPHANSGVSVFAWSPSISVPKSVESDSECPDLSGLWVGTCEETQNGSGETETTYQEMRIQQTRCDYVKFDDEEKIGLGSVKQVTESSDINWFQTTTSIDWNVERTGFEGDITVGNIEFGNPKTSSQTSARLSLALDDSGKLETSSIGTGYAEVVSSEGANRIEFSFTSECVFERQ